ncbi:hypothetical protein GUJ93_ZPchr0006g43126 [Zizania palustris]|uniref:Uncharacterized protein n=1 Tax=Zizania palustris TaxID=103762 RepID=A0A8J5SFX8_ZIZPA|nr:hypothetical protein GUJ93_ZPchr0006g43126 [Zizania palustris]
MDMDFHAIVPVAVLGIAAGCTASRSGFWTAMCHVPKAFQLAVCCSSCEEAVAGIHGQSVEETSAKIAAQLS